MQINIVYSTFAVQGQGVSEIGQLFSMTYCTVAELRGIKVAQFSDFVQFSPYKTPKTYLPVTSLQPRATSQNNSMWWSKVQRHRRFPTTSGRGAGDPQTCPNFRLWQMAISIQNATARRVRSGPKMSQNAILTTDVLSHQMSSPLPQNSPKPHFGGPFNAKSIIQIALRKSHAHGAPNVKLYGYILGIGKYTWGVSKFFH